MRAEYFNSIYRTLAETLMYSPEHKIVSRNGDELNELVNQGFTLIDPKKCFATCRDFSKAYLQGEIEFYLSGSPYLKDIFKHSKFWEKCSDDGRSINSNYGKLLLHDVSLHGYTQFEYAYEMLSRNLDSKKAVMVMYHRDHAYKSNDNPCTMFLQFLYRGDLLHLFVKMRSSDIWFGLPYDVPFFCMVQAMMARRLGVQIGTYNHQATSLHLYKRNKEQLKKVLTKNVVGLDENFKEQKELYRELIAPSIGWRKEWN